MILQAANAVRTEQFIDAFNQAYDDYFINIVLTKRSFEALVQRESVDLSASVVAIEGERVVGVAMLAQRGKEGWIGGVGVIPSHRRQQIGRRMMEYLIQQAKSLQISTLYLEVIEDNVAAFHLYDSLGFEITRRLLVLERDKGAAPVPDGFVLQELWAQQAMQYFDRFHRVPNPWQRRKHALESLTMGMTCWGIALETAPETLLGYCLGWVGHDRIHFMDIGLKPDFPKQTELSLALFASIHNDLPEHGGQMVNHAENHAATPALFRLDYYETMAQKEMALHL